MLKNDQSPNYFFSHHLYITYTIALNYQSINISTKPQRTINYIEFFWHVPIAEPPNIDNLIFKYDHMVIQQSTMGV